MSVKTLKLNRFERRNTCYARKIPEFPEINKLFVIWKANEIKGWIVAALIFKWEHKVKDQAQREFEAQGDSINVVSCTALAAPSDDVKRYNFTNDAPPEIDSLLIHSIFIRLHSEREKKTHKTIITQTKHNLNFNCQKCQENAL